jgi:hypothetical protein
MKMCVGDVSINQFIVNALAERISALKTEAYLQERAARGSREHALSVLDKVADVPADEVDRL